MKVFPCACVGEVNRNRNYVKIYKKLYEKVEEKKQKMFKHVKAIRNIYRTQHIRVYQVYIQFSSFYFCNTTHNLIFFLCFQRAPFQTLKAKRLIVGIRNFFCYG